MVDELGEVGRINLDASASERDQTMNVLADQLHRMPVQVEDVLVGRRRVVGVPEVGEEQRAWKRGLHRRVRPGLSVRELLGHGRAFTCEALDDRQRSGDLEV
jgi:hypothetical protein